MESNRIWDNVKLEVWRMYMEKKMSLKDTKEAIERDHGLEAPVGCIRTWKSKVVQGWGFKKNKTKTMKRSREEEIILFTDGDAQHTLKEIKNCKRRKLREVSPSTDSGMAYLSSNNGGDNLLQEDAFERLGTRTAGQEGDALDFTSSIPTATFSNAPTLSVGLLDSEPGVPLNRKMALLDVPPISMLDLYISDKIQPWSPLAYPSHTLITRIRQLFLEIAKVENVLGQSILSHIICRIKNAYFLEANYPKINQQSDDIDFVALGDLLGCIATYVENWMKHGELSPLTLLQEFMLAKAAEKYGYHEEAEYHCRNILKIYPQVSVQSFLGMILAKSSRLKEATTLFFASLTGFIVQFPSASTDVDFWHYYAPIDSLLAELVLRNEPNSLTLVTICADRILKTISMAQFHGTLHTIFPELYIHGFHIAQECSKLGLIDSAIYIYQELLGNTHSHLDPVIHGFEKSTAQREYGHLLKSKGVLAESVQQLFLACQSALNSGTNDSRHIALLSSDYKDLRSYPGLEPSDKGFLAQEIGIILAQLQQRISVEQASQVAKAALMEAFLSSDLPIYIADAIPCPAQFRLPLRVAASVLEGDHAWTTSASVISSSKPVTYSENDWC